MATAPLDTTDATRCSRHRLDAVDEDARTPRADSGYAWASWYVTKMEGSRTLSTVESYSWFLAALRRSGVNAFLTPLQNSPVTTRTKKTVWLPLASGSQ